MKGKRFPLSSTHWLLLFTLLAGCSTPSAVPLDTNTPTNIPTAPSLPTATLLPPTSVLPAPTATLEPTALPPEHRIAIRTIEGVGEFYDRITGEKFIPRGNNYIRVASQQSYSGEAIFYHSTFNTDQYNPEEVEMALTRMQEQGYNVARVFVTGACRDYCLGDQVAGLRDGYISNVADFLTRAKSHNIYVIITLDGEPASPYYIRLLDTTWSNDFQGTNKSYLTGGGVLVAKEFWQDFIGELLSQAAPLDAILAYELRNELFYEANATPLTYQSGVFTTVNGKSYDLASTEDRQDMMDENLLYWIDQVQTAILERDPTALVTVGFFVPQAPNPTRIGDMRLIETQPVIWQSNLDFIDLHPYPGFSFSLSQYVENFGMQDMLEKPIIMGEFGAIRSSYSSENKAARALQDWQAESCQYGFDGWLFWTYDMPDQIFYNALSGEAQIDQALAPINRPDPCEPASFTYTEKNLALGAQTEASRSLPDQPSSGAVDGTTDLWWGAGAPAPQWILIDLGSPQTIAKIRLAITQSPPGETIHQIWVGSHIDNLELLYTFEGYTVFGQVLEFTADTPLENIRYVRVNTRQSPSWVGWEEIEVLAP
jgi:hypothetical protein